MNYAERMAYSRSLQRLPGSSAMLFGPDERPSTRRASLLATMQSKMRTNDDFEACLFAVADAL